MDPRYTNPAVTHQWMQVTALGYYSQIHSLVAVYQRQAGVIPHGIETTALTTPLQMTQKDAASVREIERRTKHDVAAYVAHARAVYNAETPGSGRWLHYGLTSSDLVDTALSLRFQALIPVLRRAVESVNVALRPWRADPTMVLGRTHGQPAEPMPLASRADHWGAMFNESAVYLLSHATRVNAAKLSGPVGTFAHTPPQVEEAVAQALGLVAAAESSSQIVPRVTLAHWASSASNLVAVCAKIALDLRLMNLLGEVRNAQAPGQVGSSVMPHKNNPIQAEQIGGMARLASGYAQMLQPLDLWLERDISHSSVERIAVPDLWHVLLHTLNTTRALLVDTGRDRAQMLRGLYARPESTAVRTMNELIRSGKEPEAARSMALRSVADRRPDAAAFRWFGRNYGSKTE